MFSRFASSLSERWSLPGVGSTGREIQYSTCASNCFRRFRYFRFSLPSKEGKIAIPHVWEIFHLFLSIQCNIGEIFCLVLLSELKTLSLRGLVELQIELQPCGLVEKVVFTTMFSLVRDQYFAKEVGTPSHLSVFFCIGLLLNSVTTLVCTTCHQTGKKHTCFCPHLGKNIAFNLQHLSRKKREFVAGYFFLMTQPSQIILSLPLFLRRNAFPANT